MAFEVELAENRYGKSRVRLHKVTGTSKATLAAGVERAGALQGDFENSAPPRATTARSSRRTR